MKIEEKCSLSTLRARKIFPKLEIDENLIQTCYNSCSLHGLKGFQWISPFPRILREKTSELLNLAEVCCCRPKRFLCRLRPDESEQLLINFSLSRFHLKRKKDFSCFANFRPVLNESEPLNLTFGITLQQIIDVVAHLFLNQLKNGKIISQSI